MNRNMVIAGVLVMALVSSAKEQAAANKTPAETANLAAGKQTYVEYCAVCHGVDARGMGPSASALRTPPSDLTTLGKRHGGKFPYKYVGDIVRQGKPIPAHGSADMPIWGPIFGVRDNGNEAAVRQRIKNLCDFLAALQEKES
jgi:mono/diheme cytochrome c family protein